MTQAFLLTLNAGSSSIKLGLFDASGGKARAIGRGSLDLHRQPLSLSLQVRGAAAELPIDAALTDDLQAVVDAMLAALARHGELGDMVGAGHRVVHGGLRFHGAVRIDDAALAAIEELSALAPLHQPQSLRLICALRRMRPDLPQTASFDTAFHASQDDLVRRFALPRALHDAGIRRYGFHGLSYSFIARELALRRPALAAGRVVAAHLGNGASLCALHAGRSVESSMGFSVLDGVPMGTRCGALDAGVVLHLLQRQANPMTVHEVEDLLYHRAGLLGMSGISADARVLEASAEPAARQALEIFALRCAGEAARLATTLGGIDALVFTAGIGEHDARLRAAICAHLGWLGVRLDAEANARHAECISDSASRVAVCVIATDEEQVIADEGVVVLGL